MPCKSFMSKSMVNMKRFISIFSSNKMTSGKLPQGVAGGSGGRGLCHRWHCGSFGWELGGVRHRRWWLCVGGCVSVLVSDI